MLDLGWPELFIIMLVALLVVGPKELPGLVRTAASWLRKTKLSINNFQTFKMTYGKAFNTPTAINLATDLFIGKRGFVDYMKAIILKSKHLGSFTNCPSLFKEEYC